MIAINIEKELNGVAGKMILDVNFQIQPRECVALYGKSGAGKTTLLRILAGLAKPDKGRVVVDEEVWLDTSERIFISPQKRKLGFLFQDYALFPNMSVLQNLQFALLKGQSNVIIKELIEIMELGNLQFQMPNKLSGGQKQRVALARALIQQPKLLLLDEPLSALDVAMREKLQDYLLEVQNTYQLTTILVSHDKEEIIKLTDKVFHLDHGKMLKEASTDSFFKKKQAIQLVGIVEKLFKQNEKEIAVIRLNRQLIEMETAENNDWKIGQNVSITVSNE